MSTDVIDRCGTRGALSIKEEDEGELGPMPGLMVSDDDDGCGGGGVDEEVNAAASARGRLWLMVDALDVAISFRVSALVTALLDDGEVCLVASALFALGVWLADSEWLPLSGGGVSGDVGTGPCPQLLVLALGTTGKTKRQIGRRMLTSQSDETSSMRCSSAVSKCWCSCWLVFTMDRSGGIAGWSGVAVRGR